MKDVIIVKKAIKIEEGKQTGIIHDFKKSDTSQYDYIDVLVQLDDYPEIQPIKAGFSCKNWEISEVSALGLFLRNSGLNYVENDELTFDKIKEHLLGKQIEFTTYNDKNGFAKIVLNTIKFI